MQIKVRYNYNGKICRDQDYVFSDCVPRVDEYISIQYWECPVYKVEYNIVKYRDGFNESKKLDATIYVDVSNTDCSWETL